MRKAISYVEPHIALAGEKGTWKFIYVPTHLPKGTLLRFDLGSKGRNIDWEAPEVDLKKDANVIYAILENNKIIPAKLVRVPNQHLPLYQFEIPQEIKAGSPITIIVGAKDYKKAAACRQKGNTAQLTIQRRRTFQLFVDTTKKGNFADPETFTLDVKGNVLTDIKILTPSFAIKNRRFDIVLRFEDEYGNLTSNTDEDTLLELSHENLRGNLKWNIFVPETGFIILPNLYFNEEGVFTITLKNTKTNQEFFSSPIKCFSQEPKQLFWGTLHGESDRFDSTESIENCLRHFRDEKAVNFFATSPFESAEETSQEIWKKVSQHVEDFNEDERFTCFLGCQWAGESKSEGLRQIIYPKDHKPILRKKEARYNSLKKIYQSHDPKELISIPCFTMGSGHEFDFHNFNPDFERVCEIYNAWGSSEQSSKQGNAKPILGSGKLGCKESNEGALIKALVNNCRFGFVAGGLDDRGVYASFFDADQKQYTPGITAILTEQLSRQQIFDALYNRHCYATTGPRIIVGLFVAGALMGSELSTQKKPGLHVIRHISGYVAGTARITSIELMRNGKVLTTFTSKNHFLDFTYDDLDLLSDIALESPDKRPPFIFYYLRITQQDGHMAWSSPIWIDCVQTGKLSKGFGKGTPTKEKPPAKKTKKLAVRKEK